MKIEELDDSVVILDPDQENSTDSSFTSSNESMPALNDDELLLDDSIVEIVGFVNPELSTEEESEVQTSEIQSSLSPQIKEIDLIFDRVEEKIKELEEVFETGLKTEEERRVPSLDISDLSLGAENDSDDTWREENTLTEFLQREDSKEPEEKCRRKRKPESVSEEVENDVPSNEQFVKPCPEVGESLYVDMSRKVCPKFS